ncbi:putative short-chain dehydrogenase/reductase family protein [Thermoascus aurantiacus ATCC 26904]
MCCVTLPVRLAVTRQDLAALTNLITQGLRNPAEFYSSIGPTLNELTFGLLGSSFNPEKDINDLTGKVVFVTGANTGLGKETVLQLARHRPSVIYLAARNKTKAHNAIASIKENLSSPVDIRYMPLDLASFKSIRAAAEKFTSECDRLDILVLNAGTMGNPPGTTEAGHEIQFGTNHVGHFLLTKLLLPTLLKTAASATPVPDVRVVTVSSVASQISPPFEVMTSTSALLAESTWHRYAASKAANIAFAAELARRYPQILSVSVHPGVVASDLYETSSESRAFLRYAKAVLAPLVMRTVRTGALNQLWAAGAKRELLTNGAYYTPVGVIQKNNKHATDVELGKKLWEWTDAEVSEKQGS